MYVNEALPVHMKEAVQEDPLTDVDAQQWLDSFPKVRNMFVKCAAEIFGPDRLIELGDRLERQGDMYRAARRLRAAGNTAAMITFAEVERSCHR